MRHIFSKRKKSFDKEKLKIMRLLLGLSNVWERILYIFFKNYWPRILFLLWWTQKKPQYVILNFKNGWSMEITFRKRQSDWSYTNEPFKAFNTINHSLFKANSFSGTSPKLMQGYLSNRSQGTYWRDRPQISLLILISELSKLTSLPPEIIRLPLVVRWIQGEY